MRSQSDDIITLARGHWAEILPSMGVGTEFLADRHGPCPGCGGRDRFRWDDRAGRGTFVCGGGGDTLTGASSWSYLQKTFATASSSAHTAQQ